MAASDRTGGCRIGRRAGPVRTRSAGILLYQLDGDELLVLLAHPGGPYWSRKDDGAWSIPKGEIAAGEDAAAAARREFFEETGFRVSGELLPLGTARQSGGKVVEAFAAAGELYPEKISPNSFSLEWPPRGGKLQNFPEIDRVAWFTIDEAHEKINAAQRPFLDAVARIARDHPSGTR